MLKLPKSTAEIRSIHEHYVRVRGGAGRAPLTRSWARPLVSLRWTRLYGVVRPCARDAVGRQMHPLRSAHFKKKNYILSTFEKFVRGVRPPAGIYPSSLFHDSLDFRFDEKRVARIIIRNCRSLALGGRSHLQGNEALQTMLYCNQ